MNEANDTQDDELLSRYLDDELEAAEADRLTERLAREPALARRLESLRGADDATRALFARLDELPLPSGVTEMLTADEPRAPATVVPIRRPFAQRFLELPVALAASLALAVGFFADRLLEGPGSAPGAADTLAAGTVPAGSALHALLEEQPSGASVTLADGTRGSVRLTFADADGNWCRQLDLENARRNVNALACRRDDRWQTEFLAFGEPAGGAYQPASAPAVAAALASLLGDGAVLGADEEAAVLAADWMKKQ